MATSRSATKALPTGTVTFLFTDIEGSTRLLEALGDRYESLFADHCRIIRGAIAAGGGTEVNTEGDAFFAVFPAADGAVKATVEAQRGLARHEWPEGSTVRVRMGLHTGEGRLGGSDYLGIDVHRAARIAGAGNGGQVLVSDATRALVENAVPEGITLRDLGAHRLKDLARPEHIYQLQIEGLSADFAPIRTLDAHPNNLPLQLTSFVGRDAEIAVVRDLVQQERLVTLTGPGGTGKTRLALQVAAERLGDHPDGVFFVELAPITDPALVASAIAAALGIREAVGRSLEQTLREELRDKAMLVVLDNFEQVIDAAPLVGQLLATAARLRVLVTSRAVLHVQGEREYPVPPLRIPDPAELPSLEALSGYEAVTLFVERAMSIQPDFAVTNTSAAAVAEIVARLDGLPLAIELAAARTRVLTPQAILARLGSRLAFLGGGARDLPARQQTLRHAIDWSYELLAAPEQGLLRRLAVFAGGASLEAVEPICRPSELGIDVLDGLSNLVEQSLLRRGEDLEAEPRFEMLETIREYAAERLQASGEAQELAERHARHFLAVAEAAEPDLTRDPQAIARIDRDHDNFRTALRWAIDRGDSEVGFGLAFALWRFWHQRAHLAEGRDWFERILALPGAERRTLARARGLTGAAGIAYWQNDYAAAGAWYDEAESIFRELDDKPGLADALYNTASMAALAGDVPGAMDRFREGADIARQLGDDHEVMRFVGAEGYAAFMTDDFDSARSLLNESLALAQRTEDKFAIGGAHHTVGQVARMQGRLDDAAVEYRDSIRTLHELGDAASLTEPLQGLAAVLIDQGRAEVGVRLLAANAAIRERIGGGPPPEWLRLGDPLARARENLGEEAYATAWEMGKAVTVDEAVSLALSAD
jgi:predicted ATPase/class 3 adenylate cyclase